MSRLISFDEIPKHMIWMRENPFIFKHYRPPTRSFITCIISSVSQFHTETLNILTHLIPTLVALYILIYFWLFNVTISPLHHGYSWEQSPVMDKFIISLLLISFSICFGFSTIFHAFSCHMDYGAHLQFADFCGIFFTGFSSGTSYSFFILYTHHYLFLTNLIVNIVVTFLFLFLIRKPFVNYKLKTWLTLIFIIYGIIIFSPISFYLVFFTQVELYIFIIFTAAMCIAFVGGVIYALKIPESRKPGLFDIWGQSHTIMHMCSILVALLMYEFILQIARCAYAHSL